MKRPTYSFEERKEGLISLGLIRKFEQQNEYLKRF